MKLRPREVNLYLIKGKAGITNTVYKGKWEQNRRRRVTTKSNVGRYRGKGEINTQVYRDSTARTFQLYGILRHFPKGYLKCFVLMFSPIGTMISKKPLTGCFCISLIRREKPNSNLNWEFHIRNY